ncbi:MAG: hypothetical protein ABSA06_14545, partial [Geobacteraceae bacterium]
ATMHCCLKFETEEEIRWAVVVPSGRSVIWLRGSPKVSNRLELSGGGFQCSDIQYGSYLNDCENAFDWNLLNGFIFTENWSTHTIVNK